MCHFPDVTVHMEGIVVNLSGSHTTHRGKFHGCHQMHKVIQHESPATSRYLLTPKSIKCEGEVDYTECSPLISSKFSLFCFSRVSGCRGQPRWQLKTIHVGSNHFQRLPSENPRSFSLSWSFSTSMPALHNISAGVHNHFLDTLPVERWSGIDGCYRARLTQFSNI